MRYAGSLAPRAKRRPEDVVTQRNVSRSDNVVTREKS
jgi:hypothetical protein